MLTTKERLDRLQREASGQYILFEKRKKRRNAACTTVRATIATTALAIGVTAVTETSTAVTKALGTLMFMTIAAHLALMDNERDRNLHRLSEDWWRHRIEASRLLARDAVQNPGDTPDDIRRETVELERNIAETRGDSLLHDPHPGPEAPADDDDPAAPPPTSGSNVPGDRMPGRG